MEEIQLSVDGHSVRIEKGASLLAAARRAGVYIPTLCHHDDLPPETEEHACGLCVVAVNGTLERACHEPATEAAVVETVTPALVTKRREAVGKLLGGRSLPGDCELLRLIEHVGMPADPPPAVGEAMPVIENPLFTREVGLCVACGRCVRVCGEFRGVGALERSEIDGEPVVLPKSNSLDSSSCRLCGACVEVCPTGALRDNALPPGDRAKALVPCRTACPAGVDIPLTVALVAEGRLGEAAAVARNQVGFPTVLGHVCYRPCEEVCRRGRLGEPVAICDIERIAGESEVPAPVPAPHTGANMAVIGGGPAGLSAAFQLRLRGHGVTVFEAEPEVGGMLRYGISPERLPRPALARDLEVLDRMDVEIREGERVANGVEPGQLAGDYDAVIVAVGAGRGRTLDVPGAELPGVSSALDFLKAACDGRSEPEVEGRIVAIIGGGSVAMDAASSALGFGAEAVHLFCLEAREEMPAHAVEIDAAVRAGVKIHARWGLASCGGRSGKVDSLEMIRCVSVIDEAGGFDPQYDASQTGRVPVDVVLLAVGRMPDPTVRAATEGLPMPVVRVGEAATGPETVARAVAAGRAAAVEVHERLGFTEAALDFAPEVPPSSRLEPREGFAAVPRAEVPLTEETAVEEANRCLRCNLRFDLKPPPHPPTP